jgi:predicted TIM-barrel fold metal-dependent hydrolase
MSKTRTLAELSAWQAVAQEPALDPAREIVDAHHHMWERPPQRYEIEEFSAEMRAGHNVVASIFVECTSNYRDDGPEAMRPVGETEHVAQQAIGHARADMQPCAAILGHADLMLGAEAGPVLDAHIAAGRGRFRGVRVQAQHDEALGSMARRAPQAGMLGSAKFRAGVQELTRRELVLDVYLYFTQLDELVALARAAPDTRIVLNHCGTPLGIGRFAGRRDDVFAAWRDGVLKLSAFQNVCVKLGGLGMPLCGFGFEDAAAPPGSAELAQAWRPYIDTLISLFGAERAMFESNFPVDKQSCSYVALWNAFKRICAGCSDAEKEQLFAATAKKIYSIAP